MKGPTTDELLAGFPGLAHRTFHSHYSDYTLVEHKNRRISEDLIETLCFNFIHT